MNRAVFVYKTNKERKNPLGSSRKIFDVWLRHTVTNFPVYLGDDMSDSYLHNKHCVTGGGFHFQFTPKYRQPVFEDAVIKDYVRKAFKIIADELGIELECIEFGPDHTHLFVTDVKNYSQSKLAGVLKGKSSWMVRRDLTERVKRYEWGESFWSDGFFCEAIGSMTQENVEFYITRQQKKHWIRPVMKTRNHTRITQFTLGQYN
jgi:putative transposase